MRRKDAIKDYNYFEMEEAFEKADFSYSDIQMIQSKMDFLMNEYHNELEVPFNRIIRLFCDDAKIYYAMNYLFSKGYKVCSYVDIDCENENYIYIKSFRDYYPKAYSAEKQKRMVAKVASLRKKLILNIIKYYPDVDLDEIDDFTSLSFLNFINNVDIPDVINCYNEYIQSRNELSTHNIRVAYSVARSNHYMFDDESQMREFYLYSVVVGVEKYFKKLYSALQIVNGEECNQKFLLSTFLYNYTNYMALSYPKNKSNLISLISKYDVITNINKLLDQGNDLNEISSLLNMSISEVLYLVNISKDVLSLDDVNDDIYGYRLYDKKGAYGQFRDSIYGGFDEEESFDDILCKEELHDWLFQLLDLLKDRDKFIIMSKYGFVDGRPWSYREIGKYLGISHQRVHQIEKDIEDYMKILVLKNKETKKL